MNCPEFQDRVAIFVTEHRLEVPVEARILDLVSEVGEVSKEVLKATQYGRQPLQPTDAWTEELADTFFALICIANSTNVNLEVALTDALQKYKQRLTLKGEAGSGR